MKTYNQNDLVIDHDIHGCAIIQPDVLKQLIADANRYQYLKTADHWCLKRFGDTGWEYLNSDDSWDEIIDVSSGDSHEI